MNTYAIGDLQGCHAALLRLLEAIRYRPGLDQLWFAGDLVNRGPDSLAVLRFIRALGDEAICVLGNHDLHLLARAEGREAGRLDTLDEVLAAPDAVALLDWLASRPLLHEAPGWAMSHAGLAPEWDMPTARTAARAAETVLRRHNRSDFLMTMYGNEPSRWTDANNDAARLRFSINAFTRMRYCSGDGALDFKQKCTPGQQPRGLSPWFEYLAQKVAVPDWIFGHWSTLGRVHWPEHGVWGLDTGAVWGGKLTALDLESRTLTQVDCPENFRADAHGMD